MSVTIDDKEFKEGIDKFINQHLRKSSSSSVISFLLRPVRVNILLVHIFIRTWTFNSLCLSISFKILNLSNIVKISTSYLIKKGGDIPPNMYYLFFDFAFSSTTDFSADKLNTAGFLETVNLTHFFSFFKKVT